MTNAKITTDEKISTPAKISTDATSKAETAGTADTADTARTADTAETAGPIEMTGMSNTSDMTDMTDGSNTTGMTDALAEALSVLHDYVRTLSHLAGMDEAYGEQIWQGIRRSTGLLQELAYFHDYGQPLCRYSVAGYTLADVLVWQVDHFKLYMDRPDEMNRYRQPRLLLSAFGTMIQMEKDPKFYADKMRYETGQDIIG